MGKKQEQKESDHQAKIRALKKQQRKQDKHKGKFKNDE